MCACCGVCLVVVMFSLSANATLCFYAFSFLLCCFTPTVARGSLKCTANLRSISVSLSLSCKV